MAGDWIPISTDLPGKPEIARLSVALGKPIDEIVGTLIRFWIWVQSHTADGYLEGLDVAGAAAASQVPVRLLGELEKVGWLQVADIGLTIPKYDRWFSGCAKRRLQTLRRVVKYRQKGGCNADVTLPALQKRYHSRDRDREFFDADAVEKLRGRDGGGGGGENLHKPQDDPGQPATPPPNGQGSSCDTPATPWDWWQRYAPMWPRGRPCTGEDTRLLWRVATKAADGDALAIAALEELGQRKRRNPGAYLHKVLLNIAPGAMWGDMQQIVVPDEILHPPSHPKKPPEVKQQKEEIEPMSPEERAAWEQQLQHLRRLAAAKSVEAQ